METIEGKLFLKENTTPDICFNINGKDVLRITENDLFYHGRKIEAEEELVVALRVFLTTGEKNLLPKTK